MTKRGRSLRASHRQKPRAGKQPRPPKRMRTKNSKNQVVGGRPGYGQFVNTKRKTRVKGSGN